MQAKTVGRLTGMATLVVAFVAANIGTPLVATPADANPIIAAPDFQAAGKTAQTHVHRFFDFATSKAAARADPMVKVLVDGQSLWLQPASHEGSVFEGLSVSGDTVMFTQEDVQDWMFSGRNNRLYGSFETRASLVAMSAPNAARVAAALSTSPTPNWW